MKSESQLIAAVEKSDASVCEMIFHLTDAKRMLASVDRISSAGNKVEFGPVPEDCFLQNIQTGKKIFMKKSRGVYVLDVFFIVGDERIAGEIIVDSGAAESAMPKDWFPNLPVLAAKEGVSFAAANGGAMGNDGRQKINFIPRTSDFPRQA